MLLPGAAYLARPDGLGHGSRLGRDLKNYGRLKCHWNLGLCRGWR